MAKSVLVLERRGKEIPLRVSFIHSLIVDRQGQSYSLLGAREKIYNETTHTLSHIFLSQLPHCNRSIHIILVIVARLISGRRSPLCLCPVPLLPLPLTRFLARALLLVVISAVSVRCRNCWRMIILLPQTGVRAFIVVDRRSSHSRHI